MWRIVTGLIEVLAGAISLAWHLSVGLAALCLFVGSAALWIGLGAALMAANAALMLGRMTSLLVAGAMRAAEMPQNDRWDRQEAVKTPKLSLQPWKSEAAMRRRLRASQGQARPPLRRSSDT